MAAITLHWKISFITFQLQGSDKPTGSTSSDTLHTLILNFTYFRYNHKTTPNIDHCKSYLKKADNLNYNICIYMENDHKDNVKNIDKE